MFVCVCVCLLLVQNYAGRKKSPGLVDSAERCCLCYQKVQTASPSPIPLLAVLVRVLRQWRVII